MFKTLFNKKTNKVILNIEGMHCEGCSRTLSGVLRNTKGVRKSEISLQKNEANLEFHPERTSVEEIIHAIQVKTPYRVTGKSML